MADDISLGDWDGVMDEREEFFNRQKTINGGCDVRCYAMAKFMEEERHAAQSDCGFYKELWDMSACDALECANPEVYTDDEC
jgi:hypothetical protein